MINLIKKIIEFFLLFCLKFNYFIYGKLAFISPKSSTLLKQYLLTDHQTRQWFISKCSMPLFRGLHPKNVFNYRSEFFIENVDENDIVIDVACGTGLILHKVSTKIKKGYGVEIDRSNLSICKTKHAAYNVEYIGEDIMNLNYDEFKKSTGYTTAIFSHILEHIENVPEFLKKVDARKILVCVPSQENWLAQLKIYLGLPYFLDDTHFREYSREMLAHELKQAGYSIKYIGFNPEGEIICRAEIK